MFKKLYAVKEYRCPAGIRALPVFAMALIANVPAAYAHVSEQGFILLLPTDIYIVTGCAAVLISILAVFIIPGGWARRLFCNVTFPLPSIEFMISAQCLRDAISILSLMIILAAIMVGGIGTGDPLTNILPLMIWTLWWIVIVMIHCLIGNLWRWINPWTGLYNLIIKNGPIVSFVRLPAGLGCWPGVGLFILFYIFLIADIAPDNPARLSNIVLIYLIFTLLGMIIFGRDEWLERCECFTIFFGYFAKLSPVYLCANGKGFSVGLPGWRAVQEKKLAPSHGIFLLSMLACGSFDGLNETFWWLAQVGVNPLAFPGRSAVIFSSLMGMVGANLALYFIFVFCIALGKKLAEKTAGKVDRLRPVPQYPFMDIFCALAVSLLPIAAAYHASHYLVSLLVNGQYLIAAISDPLASGANLLNLQEYQVTTGFLNTSDSVKRIWLTQAGLIVCGHILAVFMAHYIIAHFYINHRQAMAFHLPIAVFMAGYTWFGLWLLAAPKGA